MNIEEIKKSIDRQMIDGGLVKDFEEQAVRLLLFHLCIAIDIYRHMTQAEKYKAGYWYREKFKNSFSLTGFLKERKRKREKKKSPLHPSYKEYSGVKEKSYKTLSLEKENKEKLEEEGFKERQQAFGAECKQFIGKYSEETVAKFYCYWAEQVNGTGLMLWETRKSWNTNLRLAAWARKGYEKADKAAALRLERVKGKKSAPQAVNTQELQAIAAERAADNERLEQEIAARKQGAVSYEEYLNIKEKQL